MQKKINIGILFGGQSAEHEISLRSAQNVISALDEKKYNITLIGISKDGRWFLQNKTQANLTHSETLTLAQSQEVAICPGHQAGRLVALESKFPQPTGLEGLDVIFPVVHGPMAEDGTVQGLLRLTNIAFVGSQVLGSAVAMDKVVSKGLMRDAGLPIANFMVYHDWEKSDLNYERVSQTLGVPFFVKPANMGSSVGVSKVTKESEFQKAIDDAFLFDQKVVIEEFIKGREIELAVLGNDHPEVTKPGEIVVKADFYSYAAKYLDHDGAQLDIPAKNLSAATVLKLQELAVKTFRVLCCLGMARVDFFVTADEKIYVNELNSIPGFTSISMFPKLWEHSGLSYSALIDRLVELAMEQNQKDKRLRYSYF